MQGVLMVRDKMMKLGRKQNIQNFVKHEKKSLTLS